MENSDSSDTDEPRQPAEHERARDDGAHDNETHDSGTTINRRTTLQLLAVVGGVGAFSSTGGAEMDAVPQSADATAKAKQEPVPDGTDALLSYIEANYGDQLSADDLDHVRGDIASDLRSAKALDAVELDYTVDPAFTFRAYRGDDC